MSRRAKTELELQMWREAAGHALIAMGREEKRAGRRSGERRWKADDDPLAHWCLTELFVAFAAKWGKIAS